MSYQDNDNYTCTKGTIKSRKNLYKPISMWKNHFLRKKNEKYVYMSDLKPKMTKNYILLKEKKASRKKLKEKKYKV